MLKESLFKITQLTHNNGHINAELQIDQQNQIFAGHFPDQPVVPGACMLQVVKEVLVDALKVDVGLTRADNIKFLSLVEPATAKLQLNIVYHQSESSFKVKATLSAAEITCMKLQGIFTLR